MNPDLFLPSLGSKRQLMQTGQEKLPRQWVEELVSRGRGSRFKSQFERREANPADMLTICAQGQLGAIETLEEMCHESLLKD